MFTGSNLKYIFKNFVFSFSNVQPDIWYSPCRFVAFADSGNGSRLFLFAVTCSKLNMSVATLSYSLV